MIVFQDERESRDRLRNPWSLFVFSLVTLVRVLILLAPWMVVGGPVFWAVRGARRRWRGRASDARESASVEVE